MSQLSTALSRDEKRSAGRTGLSNKQLLSFEDLRTLGLRWSRQWLHAQVKAGKFPAPLKLGPATNAWLRAEWDRWLAERAAERGAAEETE